MSTGIIYKIVHKDNEVCDVVYVGSTTTTLKTRWWHHKCHYKEYLRNVGCEVAIFPYFDTYGFDNFDIIELEACIIDDKRHLLEKEQQWIYKLDCCNKKRALITEEEKKDYKKEKVECECKLLISRRNIATHRKTKKHFELLAQLQTIDFVVVV